MKYAILIGLIMLAACTAQQGIEENQEQQANIETEEIVIESDGEKTDVVLDIDNKPAEGGYCVPGTSFADSGSGGSTSSEIVGLVQYKGGEFCKAVSTTTVQAQTGDVTTETTYYFNRDQSEFWIVTSTDTGMGAPQTHEMHIVNGDPA